MRNYYLPDSRWAVSGRHAYEDRFVVKGKFHNLVPDDIINEFEIAERLMAYSYYCYPMYDEALKKLLGMTEMAVKLRCKQFGISLEYKDRNNKVRQRTLSYLMDQLLIKEPNKPLTSEFSKARKVRNHFAHPDRHSFLGGMVYHSISQVINTINYIFLEDQVCKESNIYFDALSQPCHLFENGNFLLEYNGMQYLAYGTKCLEVYPISGEWISLWVFYPVLLNIREQVETHKYNLPFYIVLKDIKINENCITGIDIESNQAIEFKITNEPTNLETIASFRKQLQECERANINIYLNWLNDEMGKQLVYHRYKNYW